MNIHNHFVVLLLLALALNLAPSCMKESLTDETIESPTSFHYSLDATMAEFATGADADDADTKASVTTVVRLSWNAGDQISVINLTTGKALGGSLTANETATTTTFSGTLNGIVRNGDKLAFIYPSQGYTEEQTYKPVTVDFSKQVGNSNSGVPLCVYSIVTANSNTFNRTSATFKFLMSYLQMNLVGLEKNSEIKSVSVDNIGSGVTLGITADGISATPVPGTITMTPPASYKVKADGTRTFYMSFAESAAVAKRTVTAITDNEIKTCDWTGAKLNNSTSYTSTLASFVIAEPNLPEYVDLGLSVKWATCNLGASKPEEYGLYYQWGDTQGYGSDTSDGKYFEWNTYIWCKGSYSTMTKYTTPSSNSTVDYKSILDPEDDAAQIALGDKWRMPTDAEWTELRENSTWTWTTENGVKGYRATSKKPGFTDKSIFLPAAGYRVLCDFYNVYSYVTLNNVTPHGFYWSSSLNTDYHYDAYGVHFGSGFVNRAHDIRCEGWSIRPVYGEVVHVSSVSLNKTSLSLEEGQSETLAATLNPSNAAEKSVIWKSSTPSVANVDANGKVTAVKAGTATITATAVDGSKTASCTVIVSASSTCWCENEVYFWRDWSTPEITWNTVGKENQINLSNLIAYKQSKSISQLMDLGLIADVSAVLLYNNSDSPFFSISINDDAILLSQISTQIANAPASDHVERLRINIVDNNGHHFPVDMEVLCKVDVSSNSPEYVDLGLSVMWATCNLGASKPEDIGGYYQWAGTEDVSSTSIYLSLDNCPYHTGTSSSTGWTKYIPSNMTSYWSGSGSPDNRTVLDLDDDAAYVALGCKWRLPTYDEWMELRSNCTWTWTTVNGIDGFRVTSNKSGYTNKSIFLPAAGFRFSGYLDNVGSLGSYWSSSLYSAHPLSAYGVVFSLSYVDMSLSDRNRGQSIRPVYDAAVHVSSILLN